MIDKTLAPIVLFAYSRPEHTRKTLESLKKNELAGNSILYIFCDGPKAEASEKTRENIRLVREIAKEDQWCGEVIIREQDNNLGLAGSISSGVTEIIEKYGKIIVLEDDLILSPAFLSYMNKALIFYENYPAVFSIGAYSYPSSIMHIPNDYPFDTYVCLRNCSWGWATWKNKWSLVDWNVNAYEYIKNNPACKAALNRMGDDEFEMLYQQQECGLNIWSIQFTIAHFVNHAIAIYPTISYVNNAGLDGTGENCNILPRLWHSTLNNQLAPKFVDILYEDSRIINAFYNVNCKAKRPLWKKVINYLYRKNEKPVPFPLKQHIYSEK